MVKKLFSKFLGVSCLSVAISSQALACPDISKIPDFNCDGKLQISIIGDSLVYGIGDTKNENKGGYVLRASKALPKINFVNLGVPGMRTRELLLLLAGAYKDGTDPETKLAIDEADIVILDVGRNDRWLFGTPGEAYRNLKRARTIIKKEVTKVKGLPPLVVTAVMMLPNRGSQGPWMKDLNSIILKKNNAKDPSDLRFDLVSKRLLSSDQIHPTPAGYTSLASTLVKYLTKKLPSRMRAQRPDSDKDDVPDVLEVNVFGTDPSLPDTDGDSRSDGDELFIGHTDPLIAD